MMEEASRSFLGRFRRFDLQARIWILSQGREEAPIVIIRRYIYK
jgi:hypothetical protein